MDGRVCRSQGVRSINVEGQEEAERFIGGWIGVVRVDVLVGLRTQGLTRRSNQEWWELQWLRWMLA